MDFVGPFPPSEGFNYMWVVLCRLTSMVHLVPVNMTVRASQLACVYVKEVVRCHAPNRFGTVNMEDNVYIE